MGEIKPGTPCYLRRTQVASNEGKVVTVVSHIGNYLLQAGSPSQRFVDAYLVEASGTLIGLVDGRRQPPKGGKFIVPRACLVPIVPPEGQRETEKEHSHEAA